MEITKEWFRKNGVCTGGFAWWCMNQDSCPSTVINNLMRDDKFNWANWVIIKLLPRADYVDYAIFATEQVLDIATDIRPKNTIEQVKIFMQCSNSENLRQTIDSSVHCGYAAYHGAPHVAYAAYHTACAAIYSNSDMAGFAAISSVLAMADKECSPDSTKHNQAKELEKRIVNYAISLVEKLK